MMGRFSMDTLDIVTLKKCQECQAIQYIHVLNHLRMRDFSLYIKGRKHPGILVLVESLAL